MIDWLLPSRAASTIAGDYGWFGVGSMFRTRSGINVSEDVALTYAAVFAATRVLAEGIGGVPLPCYEKVTPTDRQPAGLYVGDLLRYSPNPNNAAGVFREGRVANQVNWGNAFAEIEFFPGTNRPRWLWPIHPSRVFKSRDERFDYEIRSNSGEVTHLHAWEMLHIPGALSADGVWGTSIIGCGRETIGMGIATEKSAQQFFGTGGQPKGVFEAPGMQNRQKREAFRAEWESVHADPNAKGPTIAIVNSGSKYTPLGTLSNEANQLIQTRQVNKSDIATLYGIPAYKIGAEGKETAGTIEQKAIEFVVYSLLPWARKWEEQLALKLLLPDERQQYYFEHNFTALLRGDQVARFNAYRIAFSIGTLTINEIRRLENMPGIGPAGDQHFVPANMTTAERAMNGDMGNGGAMGSDHNGQPADNPMDLDADAFMRSMTRANRIEVRQQLKQLEHDLPERPQDHTQVARVALLDVLGRMATKEANAIQRAADAGGDFDAWLREFYAKHREIQADALRTACECLRIAGVKRWVDRADLSAWLVERAKQEAQAGYNSDTPTTFKAKLAAWSTDRAARITEEILTGNTP